MEICKVNFGGFINYVIFFGGIIVGFIVSVIFFRSGDDDQIINVKNELDGNENNELELKKRISVLMKEAEVCINELNELKNHIKTLDVNSPKINSDTTRSDLEESPELTLSDNSPQPIILNNTPTISPDLNSNNTSAQNPPIYFSIPTDDTGRFDLNNKKEIFDKNCYYSISVTFNNRGELSYLPSDKDFRAINDYGSYLLPVCDVDNFADKSKARNILMLEKGEVYLENGSWIVDKSKKVKIKFI